MAKKRLYIRIRDTIFYWLVLVVVTTLRLLPRRPALLIMRGIGHLIFRLSKKNRSRTIRHLTFAFGNEKSTTEIKQLAHRVFLHFTTAAADFIRLPNIIKAGINNLITVEGIEHLDQALAPGRGALMITAHFGNWELLGAWLAQNGYPLKVVGTSLFDDRLDRIIVETRNSAGYTNIARGKSTREIIRSLKDGHPVGMLIDQDTKVQGVFVNFFGQPAFTPTGPVVLARKFKLPLVPIFMRIKDDFTYHIECSKPIDLVFTDNEEHDILVNTQRCSDVYEQLIRRYPEQWVWMHKRWKTQPAKPGTE